MASLHLHHLHHSRFTYSSPSPLPPPPLTAGVAFFPSKSSPFRYSLSGVSATPLNNAEPSSSSSDDPTDSEPPAAVDRVKLAFEKAKAYKQKKAELAAAAAATAPVEEEVPDRVKAAMEKAKEYKKNKGIPTDEKKKIETYPVQCNLTSGLFSSGGNVKDPGLSKMDFVGLDFGDRKTGNRVPAGLMPRVDLYPVGELPEVEIIVGDPSKFEKREVNPQPLEEDDNSKELYKPRVSTWGVYPRPANISKAYGGGKTIRPGDALETEEERVKKEIRTKQLVAAYKNRIGLNIDPKLKSECEKILNDGDSLMNSGKLKEALSLYQEVMDKLPYPSEIHGLAALQWSICQDSLLRSSEARAMYERLQSHPVPKVSKKARQFAFSFQAMEMMKVTKSNFPVEITGYKDYFDAFVEDKAANYTAKTEDESEEGLLRQALPYIVFLVSPILMILFIAVQGKSVN
ncbi:hypothetical protein LINPERPRIM_LOCUS40113 [Linum perenne]